MKPTAAIRWGAALALAGYAYVIFKLTLQPAYTETATFGLMQRVVDRASDGRLSWDQTEVLANIALFVPAGFLLAIVLGRVWLAAIVCIGASAAIELAQQRYLPSRVPTLSDVEHNGIGGAIGALIAWPIAYWGRTAAGSPLRLQQPHSEWPTPVLARR